MEFMDILSVLFKWLHIVAGILWIGLLYWFNWVNVPFGKTQDPETMKKIVPEMLPRALYFFRWAALWTWSLGILLLLLVFYHGGLMFDEGVGSWGVPAYVMIAVVLLVYRLYDLFVKTSLGKDNRVVAAVGFIVIVAVSYAMIHWAQFSYRAYNIHIGLMFGTIMIANVWEHIWSAMKKIIPALKAGTPPDPALMAKVSQRSRHNTYLSVPLIWTMINSHTVVPGADSPLWLLGVVLVGWLIVGLLYKKSATVKGF